MALQGMSTSKLVTGGASGAVAANLIVVVDGTTAGNVAVSTYGQLGFFGVTKEVTDTNGYAAIDISGIVKIRAGGAIVAGNQVGSDASGKAVKFTSSASGGAVRQFVGVALTTAASGDLVEVLLQPCLENA